MIRVATHSAPHLSPHIKQFSVNSQWLYSGDTRFDATSYARGAFQALEAIAACPYPKESVGSLCGTIWHPVQNQARSNFKRIYTEEGFGMPFVSSRDMFFYPLRRERFLSKAMKKLGDLLVPEGWLLVSRSGTVGNVLYVSRTLAECAISDHAIRIEPARVPAGYLYAFLSSRHGQALIARGVYGATVDELEPKHLAVIPVPLADKQRQGEIHEKVAHAYMLRDEGNALYSEAIQDLHTLLGVTPFCDSDVRYFGTKHPPRAFSLESSELKDRLDATHHVPLARSTVDKLRTGKYRLVRLVQRVQRVYVAPRFARVYVESPFGTPLLQGSHVPSMKPLGLKYISNQETVEMARWIIHEGWVLVTCSGTIGRTAVVTSGQDGWAASQHILRIVPRPGATHPGFLAAFISTPYGQHQLKSKIYGGVVDELTAEDTEVISIPDVPFPDQARLGEKVVRAYEMRDEANRIEDEAVSELEALIGAR